MVANSRLQALVVCALILSGAADATAQGPAAGARSGTPARALPGMRQSAFGEIQGNALDSTNGLLRDATVRLRDARTGRIAQTQVTDRAGLFAFRSLEPGTYVVEMLNENGKVLAASQLLNVSGGEVLSAVVKLPFGLPPLGGLFGQTAASAATVGAAAAAAGVMATTVTGQPTSPR